MSYEDAKAFFEEKRYTIDFPDGHSADAEFHAADGVLQALGARKWTVVSPPRGSAGFVTSDHPMCLMHSDGTIPTMNRPVGYGLSQTTVIFPICSRIAVLGRFEGDSEALEVTERYVAHLNSIIALYAERHVLGSSDKVSFLLDQEKWGHGEEILSYLDIRDDA